jgi:hypothetical protein
MAQKNVSILTRDGNGPLRIVADRKPIECADDHSEIDRILQARSLAGDDMVLILAGDDSVMRHWTRPAGQAEPAAGDDELGDQPKGRGARRNASKTAKKKSKR